MLTKLLLISLFLVAPLLAQSPYPACTGTIGNQTVIDKEPQLVSTVRNGAKYIIQDSAQNTTTHIIKLKGTWYDIGYAYGSLMKAELATAMKGMFDYLVRTAQQTWIPYLKANLPFYLKWIPDILQMNTEDQLHALLELQYQFTVGFTPSRYGDEMKGMADASGVDLKLIIHLNMFPEFIKAQCTIAGVWGSATASGKLLQLRGLDWDYQADIVKHPLTVVYFPDEPSSYPFATFGFTGMVGAISGYSTKIGLSQKVWLPISNDPLSVFGEPFTYLLRDMLQFGHDLPSAVNILKQGKRTCRVHVGVGSKSDNSLEGVMMSFNEFSVYNDQNYTYTPEHPQMNGVMYWDRHVQPSKDTCVRDILKPNLGKINAEFMHKQLAAYHQTGDTQLAIYDFEHDLVYISYSNTLVKGFYRPLVKLDMGKLLKKDFNWEKKEFLTQ